jgi:hypothetical protein
MLAVASSIVVTIALPRLWKDRCRVNERLALELMAEIADTQATNRFRMRWDSDRNGIGEHQFLVRIERDLALPTIARRWRTHSPRFAEFLETARVIDGSLVYRGYRYRVFLPDSAGRGTTTLDDVDTARSERAWCCYAWPESRGVSGQHVMFTHTVGEVLAASNQTTRYGGASHPPPWNAAFRTPEATMNSAAATDETGADGQRWVAR